MAVFDRMNDDDKYDKLEVIDAIDKFPDRDFKPHQPSLVMPSLNLIETLIRIRISELGVIPGYQYGDGENTFYCDKSTGEYLAACWEVFGIPRPEGIRYSMEKYITEVLPLDLILELHLAGNKVHQAVTSFTQNYIKNVLPKRKDTKNEKVRRALLRYKIISE